MKLAFANRADVAYHSLEEREQKRIQVVLNRVLSAREDGLPDFQALRPLPQIRDKSLWVLRVSPRLRLIASIEEGVFKVEDIVPRDRLDRITGRYRG